MLAFYSVLLLLFLGFGLIQVASARVSYGVGAHRSVRCKFCFEAVCGVLFSISVKLRQLYLANKYHFRFCTPCYLGLLYYRHCLLNFESLFIAKHVLFSSSVVHFFDFTKFCFDSTVRISILQRHLSFYRRSHLLG